MRQLLAAPNLLTLARLASVPPLLYLTYARSASALLAALGLFLFAVVTDWADGYLARVWDQSTRIGTLLDQVVDKILVLSVLFVSVERGMLPMWLVLLNLFREFLVSDFRQLAATQEKTVGANWMGKTKFVLQVVLICIIYAYLAADAAGMTVASGKQAVFWFAAGMTALSYAFAARFFWLQGTAALAND